MTEKGFIFDYSKCVGCHACVVACYNQNNTQPPIIWRNIHKGNPIKIPLKGFINLSLACNHCIDAPCLANCPAIAYSKDAETGAIIHNPSKCIGCKYCTWACPYDAPKFNKSTGVVEKCNFCIDLQKKGLQPACTTACPTGALTFGEVDTNANPNQPGFPDVNTLPRVNLLGNEVYSCIPDMDINAAGQVDDKMISNKIRSKIRSTDEIPLILFTLLSSILTGLFVFFYKASDTSITGKLFYVGGLAVAAFASTFHLGKPLRAYRSILNIKSSWLSREILLFSLFSLFSTLYLLVETKVFFWISVVLGLALLFAIEMVYRLAIKRFTPKIHSSNTILTALTFSSIFLNSNLFVIFISLKLMLYLVRNAYASHLSLRKLLLSFLRFISLAIPLSVVLFEFKEIDFSFLIILLMVGETIDRFAYYDEIDIVEPTDFFLTRGLDA